MIQYVFDTLHPHRQYISITVKFIALYQEHEIQLPSWRPGRYELGNFAKNVKLFRVFTADGKLVSSPKTTKDRWKIASNIGEEYTIQYEYYAAELNAGSTFLSPEQLYVNPVNCCVYIEGLQHLPCQIKLNIPTNYKIACALPLRNHELQASNFDELADSPWIASSSLQKELYTINGTTFHLWFQGECKLDREKMLTDFSKFTQKQFESFEAFPFEEYHFFFQIVPYAAYHGVEHKNSTVILLGPSYSIFTSNYSELLGVSSHELYHAWNVKSIRPIELFPYDFTKENYSKLGYLCEGVTTYMGDLMLYRSGVFNLNDYIQEFDKQLQKHFNNSARFTTNVADSSFDTWLDGYVAGVPGRKLSIYTEGCLLSFALDVLLLKHTDGKYRLDDVMKRLYSNFYLHNKGVSEEDFWETIQYCAGNKLDFLHSEYYYSSTDFQPLLTEALSFIGLELTTTSTDTISRLGLKTEFGKTGMLVKAIYPDSPADKAGIMLDDEIIGINTIFSQKDLEEWLKYFSNHPKTFTILRKNTLIQLPISEDEKMYYVNYHVQKQTEPTSMQEYFFTLWSN